ncbi:unnamed protein product [Camellia sinensis]
MSSGVVLCGAAVGVGVGVGVFGSKCGGWSLEFGGWVLICLQSLEVGVAMEFGVAMVFGAVGCWLMVFSGGIWSRDLLATVFSGGVGSAAE